MVIINIFQISISLSIISIPTSAFSFNEINSSSGKVILNIGTSLSVNSKISAR